MMFASAHERPRESKRSMLATLGCAPTSARMGGRNTLDYTTPGGERVIRLHQTDILTFHKKGGFTINTGGWNTVTTRARLNAFLPGEWQVWTSRGVIHLSGTPFKETITVGPRGALKPDTKPADHDKQRKAIDAYMKEYREKGLPAAEESGGDPWVADSVSEYTMQDWIDSKYRFRLMLVLAHRYAGVSDTGIYMYLHDIDRNGGKLDRFHLGRIRRFIKHCVGRA